MTSIAIYYKNCSFYKIISETSKTKWEAAILVRERKLISKVTTYSKGSCLVLNKILQGMEKNNRKVWSLHRKKWIGTVLEQLQMMDLLDKDFKWTIFTMLRELKETIYKNTAAIKKFIRNARNKVMLLNLTSYKNTPILKKTTKLPNPNQGDIDNLNSSTTIKLIAPKKRSFQARWFHCSNKHFKINSYYIHTDSSRKIQ